MAAHTLFLIRISEHYLDAKDDQRQMLCEAQAQQHLLACLARTATSVERKGGLMGPTASRPSAGLQKGAGCPLLTKAADHQLQ